MSLSYNETNRLYKTKQNPEAEYILKKEFLKNKLQSELIDKDTIVPKEGQLIVEIVKPISNIYTGQEDVSPQILQIIKVSETSKYEIGKFIIIDRRFLDQAPLVYFSEIKEGVKIRDGLVDYTVGEYEWRLINESYILGTYELSAKGKEHLENTRKAFADAKKKAEEDAIAASVIPAEVENGAE